MKELILNNWLNSKLPGINSIIRCEGIITLLNCYPAEDSQISYALPLCETPITSLLKFNEDIWTEIEPFIKTKPHKGNIYLGGEGGMGNEGFIACTDLDNMLKWAFFFEHSNPFTQIEIENEKIHAFSTLDLKYTFDINVLEKITISHF